MLGPTIAQRSKYADVEVGITLHFMEKLEAAGIDPLLILSEEMPSSAAVEEHFFLGDLPGFEEWTQDRRMATLMAHKFRIVNKDWSNGVTIHKNEIADDQMGKVRPRIAGLAAKAARHKGDYMARCLINGFSGTAFPETGDGLSFDGALFFSDVHTLEGGPNQSNKLTVALTEAGLDSAEQKLAALTTWDGKDPLDMHGTHLIVGPKLEKTAKVLVGAAMLINAGGTAAGSNAYFMGKYQVVVSPRLSGTYDDYWFLADLSAPTKPFIYQPREPITTAAQTDWTNESMFKRGQMNFGAQARYGIGPWDWRTIVGSLVA